MEASFSNNICLYKLRYLTIWWVGSSLLEDVFGLQQSFIFPSCMFPIIVDHIYVIGPSSKVIQGFEFLRLPILSHRSFGGTPQVHNLILVQFPNRLQTPFSFNTHSKRIKVLGILIRFSSFISFFTQNSLLKDIGYVELLRLGDTQIIYEILTLCFAQ